MKARRRQADRGMAIDVMTSGVAIIAGELYGQAKIDGILGMGGSAGTIIATSAMRQLPVGFPKVMVSTLAAGDTSSYVGIKDIVLIPSVVDVAGVNRPKPGCPRPGEVRVRGYPIEVHPAVDHGDCGHPRGGRKRWRETAMNASSAFTRSSISLRQWMNSKRAS